MDNQTTDALDTIVAQWKQEKPHLNTQPMEILGRMARLAKHLETAITACHKQYDLKLGEFDVLATLRRAGAPYSLTPSELIDSMMLSSGAMTNRLDKLQTRELIIRTHSEEDRRSVTVSLTSQGIKLIDEVMEQHVQVQEKVLEGFSQQQQAQINQLFKTWLSNWEE
ncbi:MarR family transcriptional regulator [Vibrio sp. Of7-15]|uniref:MarR family winged helix-turn-helix transcriptional regulator n=1 Tax=Vibrio sp. Of7-15 TaxID=2724879 RepID=UPI001EF37845|nr:MarR family transcriptional regulator [Vibrio sp. Of7-15]MCG7496668.1 MarR family transcriptional regulator [Vibrio sp. Of7-15]